MGFLKGFYVPNAEEIIELAFSKARKDAEFVKVQYKSELVVRKERKRIKVAVEVANEIILKVVKRFPSINNLPKFYQIMLANSIEIKKLKKALGHLHVTTKVIERFEKEYAKKLWSSSNSGLVRKQFYGRLKSFIKNLNPSLKILQDAMRVIANIPAVKDLPTSTLVGLPNVGKSTFLNRVTRSNVEVKDYLFTTKRLQIGHFEEKGVDFQIIDSPGLLDRAESKQNAIERQTVIALNTISNSTIFIFDCSQSLNSQKNLFKKYVKVGKPYIVLITKIDTIEESELDDFVHGLMQFKIEDENLFRLNLLEENELYSQICKRIYEMYKLTATDEIISDKI
jgi:nucleolar GTP-binding protein